MTAPLPKPALLEQHAATERQRVEIAIGDITTRGMQLRAGGTDAATVKRYTEAYEAKADMPPIVVFRDAEGVLWLADGHHRTAGAKAAGRTKIEAIVKKGERRDAVFYAASANGGHGLALSNADKWHIVETLLKDDEWRKMSDRALHEKCHVSPSFVAKVRKTVHGAQSDTRTGKDGRTIAKRGTGAQAKGLTAETCAAITRACHHMQNSAQRWKPLIEKGASDAQISELLGREFGLGGGSGGGPGDSIAYKGGKKPSLWIGQSVPGGKPTMSGAALVAAVRVALAIPAPSEGGAAAPTKPLQQRLAEVILPAETAGTRHTVQTLTDCLLKRYGKDISPPKLQVIAALSVYGPLTKAQVAHAVGFPLDVHGGQLVRMCLAEKNADDALQLTTEGKELADRAWANPDSKADAQEPPTLGPDDVVVPDLDDAPKAKAVPPVPAAKVPPPPAAKRAPVGERRQQWMFRALADDLERHQDYRGFDDELALLVCLLGVPALPGMTWTDANRTSAQEHLEDLVIAEVADRVRRGDTAALPSFRELCDLWDLDPEKYRIGADRAIPE